MGVCLHDVGEEGQVRVGGGERGERKWRKKENEEKKIKNKK